MISVIVLVYNTEKYLDRCIQSILAQIYSDFELFFVSDESSGIWVKELKEEKVKYSEKLGLKEKILLSLDSAIVSRCLLRIGMCVKGVFKNILYKCKNTPIL